MRICWKNEVSETDTNATLLAILNSKIVLSIFYQESIVLLYVYLHCLHCDVFIVSILITTQSHLNVIRGGRRELFHEPWRSVPGAAGIEGTTTPAIPERIISIEDILVEIFTSCVTKVVIPHK